MEPHVGPVSVSLRVPSDDARDQRRPTIVSGDRRALTDADSMSLSTALHPLARRARAAELLDGAALDSAELRANLRELAMLNRLPGGTAASIAAIEALTDGARDATILDVGCGGGDMALAFARYGARPPARWRVIGVDRHPEVLAEAIRRGRGRPDVEWLLADGTRLPLADGSVSVAHTSLVIHHLEPSQAVALLAELGRVARHGVALNDLRRGLVPFVITAATVLAVARSRYTRHDGVVSARRAYNLTEIDELIRAAGLEVVSRSARWLPRVVTAAIPISP
ncbi:MAG: hypothetical protein DLM71_01565 [Chloroflexi bacterium]|nr:MAG: hypothetical protein DLM71_01565 [Chloroflexota bacterium]